MIWGYIRASTSRQSISTERQIENINKWAEDNNKEISDFFVEKPISGSSKIKDRPELSRLLTTIKKGDTLVVNDITRLSRSQMVFNMVLGLLHQADATVAFADGHIFQEDDMMSRLMTSILSFTAEWEKEQISIRTKQSLNIIKRTKALGRPDKIKWGWRNNDGKKFPHEQEQIIGCKLYSFRTSGHTFKSIKEAFDQEGITTRTGKLFSISGLHRLFKTFEKA